MSKSKLRHTISVRHRDEVEPPITDCLAETYEFWDAAASSRSPPSAGSERSPERATDRPWIEYKDSDGNYVATCPGASPGITGLGHRASWQSCIDRCP